MKIQKKEFYKLLGLQKFIYILHKIKIEKALCQYQIQEINKIYGK